MIQEKLDSLPNQPGVYLMKDRAGRIIYVGKAVNLRNRVRSYFNRGSSDSTTQPHSLEKASATTAINWSPGSIRGAGACRRVPASQRENSSHG